MADRGRSTPAPTTTVLDRDWTTTDLAGETYERTAFRDVDMTELTNRGATFTGCTFSGVEFNVSTHTGAAFTNCAFVRCTFFNSTFTDCKLVGSTFDDCTFDLLAVTGGDWSFTGLPGADLRRATFTRVRLHDADLTGARCQGAKFLGCDLSDVAWHGADLAKADLRGSELSGIDPTEVRLAGATIEPHQALVIATALGLRIGDDTTTQDADAEEDSPAKAEVGHSAKKVDWRRASEARNPDVKRAANRYGLISALAAAGVDTAHITVYHDDDEQGVYWVVDPGRGRSAVLTDDTESYAGWLEGPWPFVAKFHDADAVVEVVDYEIANLITRTIEWVTTA